MTAHTASAMRIVMAKTINMTAAPAIILYPTFKVNPIKLFNLLSEVIRRTRSGSLRAGAVGGSSTERYGPSYCLQPIEPPILFSTLCKRFGSTDQIRTDTVGILSALSPAFGLRCHIINYFFNFNALVLPSLIFSINAPAIIYPQTIVIIPITPISPELTPNNTLIKTQTP